MPKGHERLQTKLIHAGEPRPRIGGAISIPIFQTAMFESAGEAAYDDIRYIRASNTPNHHALHAKLAALENAEAALVTASGMAAISASLLAVLKTGDRLLAQRRVYGGTHHFIVETLAGLGIGADFFDGETVEELEGKRKETTRAIYVEAMTNPLLEVTNLVGVSDFARRHGLVSMIDNTFATPINFRPSELGYDLSLHSGTKYLNGHADLVAGAVIGRAELVESVRHRVNQLGGGLDPHACFLLHRGLKTLGLRMRCQNESALQLARFLEQHPAVEEVFYPGLESHRGHLRAKELFSGCGGVLSMIPRGGVEAAERFVERVQLAVHAVSLGGPETLVTRPAATSHLALSAEERRQTGVRDDLVRIAVGLEAVEDLTEDFAQALVEA